MNSKRFDIQRCHTCGFNEFETNMIEYNDRFYCGIRCKLIQERKDDENLANPPGRAVRYNER